MADQKGQKRAQNYFCNFCNYKTSKNNHYERHKLTAKHKILSNTYPILTEKGQNWATGYYICNCGKSYKHKQSLSKHTKICKKNENILESSNNEITLTNDLIIKLLNDNKEMRDIIIKQQDHMMKQQDQISELIPKVGNNNNNIQNNKFNIQVFLNEHCKDAINMSDFIKSIEVSLQQLDYTKQNGLINGLSNVIIENINKLGLYERPIHCTDIKRETLYIKEDDLWCKDIDKNKIKKAIKDISTKQFCALNNWTKENPDFQNDEHKQNYYTHTLVAIANNKQHNSEKIIKKLCNNSYIKDE